MVSSALEVTTRDGFSRREFLLYIWGASIALYLAQSTGLLVWFQIPRFRKGGFGGRHTLALGAIPGINDEPFNFPEGRFWLVNLDSDQPNARFELAPDESDKSIKGMVAIYKVCTHLGCIYAWTLANDRFECPCHGSKYRLDGRRIEAPAPRSLDRFLLEFLDADKNPIPPWEWRRGKRSQAKKEQVSGLYHGNVKSHVFHRPGCRYYNCRDCTAIFRSREEAIKAGYKPCKVCEP